MVAIARPLLSAPEIVQQLDIHVISQDRAKRQLAVALYAHYLGLRFRRRRESSGLTLGRQHRILLGPSGVGKTHLVNCAASLLGVPVAFVSAPSLVETGYVGTPVEAPFQALLEAAGGDPELAEQGIVFLDEFDKLKRARDVARDVSGEGVQKGLLTMIDGRKIVVRTKDREVTLDTSRVLFIATGAFEGLTAIVRDRLARHERVGCGLGFAGTHVERRVASETELLAQVMPDDLIRFGFLRELIGRFTGIITLDPLSRSDLQRILEEAPHSPLVLKRRMFELHDVLLQLDDDGRDALVERAEACGLGARMLQTVVNETFTDLEFHLTTLAPRGIGAARYTRAVIEGHAKPELIPVEQLPERAKPVVTAEELRREPPKGPDVTLQEELKRKIKFRLAADGVTLEPERRQEPRGDQDPPTLFDGPEKN